jgi:hypothetical protein
MEIDSGTRMREVSSYLFITDDLPLAASWLAFTITLAVLVVPTQLSPLLSIATGGRGNVPAPPQ